MLTKPDRKETDQSFLRREKFREEVLKAQAESEINCLERIKKHSAKSWKATAWRLERRFPDRYGKKSKLKLKSSALDKLVEVIKESKKQLKKDS